MIVVAPTIKHLFQGFDVTLFAYGTTGSGKTHTMRGGKSLADRGMIPRLLSNIYRKGRTIERSSDGETTVEVAMSYYEIYNDKVFDLFDAPEKRTTTGLPIREAEGGKTVVVGLTETPCNSLKEFEVLYDKANANRSTGATKLNAHSSRSHAILCVKVTISSATETRISTASAIDLAGSEDNRRTGNDKHRMVESASINKSLFVLAQCVEAISKKQARIPYRESKMTRILSIGQNNGLTVMILNLAPTKAFHLDTLSSLNFANRTKKIEVREVENEPIFKGPPRQPAGGGTSGPTLQRQPLRPLTHVVNVNLAAQRDAKNGKPTKAFDVYSDRSRATHRSSSTQPPKSSPLKRLADSAALPSARPIKISRPNTSLYRPPTHNVSKASIESIVEKKVSEILAARTLNAPDPAPTKDISAEVQQRLDSIEKRLEGQEGERAEGLSYLFMAKQHQARGEDGSALRMYELAKPYFEGNAKLEGKIERLKEKIRLRKEAEVESTSKLSRPEPDGDADESYHDDGGAASDDDAPSRTKARKPKARKRTDSPDPLAHEPPSPRSKYLLDIINSRNASEIMKLSGLGAKRAEMIVEYLNELGESERVNSLRDLNGLKGLGKKTIETMRDGASMVLGFSGYLDRLQAAEVAV
jgi:hypothetical protein